MEAIYYNEELKARFLTEKESEVLNKLFIDTNLRRCAATEYELDKDLCNWTYYEILDFYKLLGTPSFHALIMINSVYSMYCQFCLKNNLVKDNQNHFLEFTREVLATCVNTAILDQMILSRKDLLQYISQLPNARDKFIMLGLFEFGKSINQKDIVNARLKDVDFSENELYLEDRVVNISNELKEVVKSCASEDRYYSVTGRGVANFPLVDTGYLIKQYPNQSPDCTEYQKGRNIYQSFMRSRNYLKLDAITINSVTDSGKIHFINERCKELHMSAKEYLFSQRIQEVNLQFGCTIERTRFYKSYEKYLV